MEVIARYRGNYPFGSDSSKMAAYVEVYKQNLTEQQMHTYQLKSVMMKEMGSDRFIKLLKTYREGNNMMILYEYCPTSINKCIQVLSGKKPSQEGQCSQCVHCFTQNLKAIIDILIHFQIKVDLLIQNFAVIQKEGGGFQLKLFVEPDSQFLALQLPMHDHEQIKQKMRGNRTLLREFYEAEKKRMIVDFQEVLEARMGKLDSPEKQHPNFIIKGSKLVFIKDHHSPNKGEDTKKTSYSIQKMQLIHQKPKILEKPAANQRTQLKNKFKTKIQEIKANLKTFQDHHLHPNPHFQKEHHLLKQPHHNPHFQKEHHLLKQPHLQNCENRQQPSEKPRRGSNLLHRKQDWYKASGGKGDQFHHKQFFDKLQKELKQQKQKIAEDSPQKQVEDIETYQQLSDNLSRTNSSYQKQSKAQKYKMKIITSHDIQVQKLEQQPVSQNRQKGDMERVEEVIDRFRSCAGTPPLEIACCPDMGQNHEVGKEVEFPLQSKKHDPNPKSSFHLISSGAQISGLKGYVSQSQEWLGSSPPLQPSEKQCKQQKHSNTQQLSDKAREARSKAERILRQYCRGVKH